MTDTGLVRACRRLLDELGLSALFALGTGLVAKTAAITYAARTLTGPATGITVSNGDGVAGNPTLALAGDLAGLEGLATTGLGTRTGDGTWTTRSIVQPAAGITVADGDGVAGNPTLALAGDLAGLESLVTTGLGTRTGDGTWTTRSIVQPAAGITVTNGDGVLGDPTLALANDLAGLEGLITTGLGTRTGDGTWVTRALTQPAAGITIANSDGVAGSPTFALANDLAGLEGLGTTGLGTRTGDGTWTTRSITQPAAGITVADGDGVAGNPTLALANDLAALEGLATTGNVVRTGDGAMNTYTPGCFTLVAGAEAGNAIIVTLNLVDVFGTAIGRVQRCRAWLLDNNGLLALVGAWTLTIGGGGAAITTDARPTLVFETNATGDATLTITDVSGVSGIMVQLFVEPVTDGVAFNVGYPANLGVQFAA